VAAAAAGILIGNGHAGAIYNAIGPERLSGAERAGVLGIGPAVAVASASDRTDLALAAQIAQVNDLSQFLHAGVGWSG
jgi:hypothetical protein